jgi:hypothetical protein
VAVTADAFEDTYNSSVNSCQCHCDAPLTTSGAQLLLLLLLLLLLRHLEA